jgi:hypothetical protein
MKKRNIYSVKVKNGKLLDLLFAIANKKGLHICENYQYERFGWWEYFQYRVDEQQIIGSCQDTGEVVSIDEMIDLLEDSMRSNFKLNSEYTAIIDRGTKKVIVGCQQFDFDVIKELAEKLK